MGEDGTGRGGEKETFNVRALENGLRRLWLPDPQDPSFSPPLPVNLSSVP